MAEQDDEKSIDLASQLVRAYKQANVELMERVSIIKSSYSEAAKEHELIKQVQQETQKAVKSKKLLLMLEEEISQGTVKSRDIEKERENILDRIKNLTADKSLAEQASVKAQKDGLKDESELYQDITKEIEESIDKLEKMEAAAKGVEDQAKKLENKSGTSFWNELDKAFGAEGKGKQKGFFGTLKQGFSEAAKEAKKISFQQDQAKTAAKERKNIEFDKRMGANTKDPTKRGRFRDKTSGKLVSGDKVKALDSKIAKGGGGLAKRLMGSLTKVFAKLGPMLMRALGPIGIIASILIELKNAIGKVDSQLVNMSKTLMITKREAADLRMNMATAALRSGDLFVTGDKMTKTLGTLNTKLGTAGYFTGEILVSATKLLEKVKMTADATAGFVALAMVADRSLDDAYKGALGIVDAMSAAANIPIPMHVILEKVGRTSGQIRAQLQGSTEQIAGAVTQAHLLGMELGTIASAGKQILDFEQSIKAELEAELLLGKELNLEKARLYALTGDYEGLMREVAKNAGDWTSFTAMNVLQQDALAKALGMTSDQLADQLFKQETIGKTEKELRAMGKDKAADIMAQTTAQDKFNAAMDKLKSMLADIITPLIPLMDMIMSMLEPVFGLLKLLEPSINFVTMAVTAIVDTIRYVLGGFGLWGESKAEAYTGTVSAAKRYAGSVQEQASYFGMGSGDTMEGSEMRGYANEGIAMTPQIATLAEKGPEAVLNMDSMKKMFDMGPVIEAFKEGNNKPISVTSKTYKDKHADANFYSSAVAFEATKTGIYT